VKAQNGKEGKGTEGVIIIDGIGANTGSLAHCVLFAHGACRPSSDCLLIELQFGGSEELASGSLGEVVEGCFPPLPLCLRKVQHGITTGGCRRMQGKSFLPAMGVLRVMKGSTVNHFEVDYLIQRVYGFCTVFI
jgi:hypothetical protein